MRFALAPLLLLLLAARPAAAQPTEVPTAFAYGYDGFLVGGGIGLSVGYLVARDGGWQTDDDWKALAAGAGIGALAGGALGLTLGIVDLARDTPGRGYIALRDTLLGVGFGLAAGAIGGGVTALYTGEPEHILLGASIGVLAGAGLGLALGVFEGSRAVPARATARLTVAAAVDPRGLPVLMPAAFAPF